MYKPRISMSKLKKQLNDRIDQKNEDDTAKIRLKWYNRWAEISGADQLEDGSYDWEQIDWDNEFVRLEWYMCDPTILTKLGDDKYRAIGLSMIPEELHETY